MGEVTKLAVGPFKDMSGYAALARNYMRAVLLTDEEATWVLAATKYDSGSRTALPESIKNAMSRKISSDIKVNLQILTPNEMSIVPNAKNIGICCWETDRIPKYWAESLNRFDNIIVPCVYNEQVLRKSGVEKKISVLPMPAFKEDYDLSNIQKYKIPGIPDDATIYYNISQWSHKKGIDAAIRAYFLAFQNGENVILLLKGYVGMMQQRGDGQKLLSAINEIKSSMRLKRYPEIFITDEVTDDLGIKKYHATGDCYINMSRGEGWCIPAFDAAMMGKELVTVDHSAMSDWVEHKYTWTVSSTFDSVHNMPHPDPDLYTANENWHEPNVLSCSQALKRHFNGQKRNNEEYKNFLLEEFNPIKIGNKIKEIINE